jgi:hypothetical protein
MAERLAATHGGRNVGSAEFLVAPPSVLAGETVWIAHERISAARSDHALFIAL